MSRTARTAKIMANRPDLDGSLEENEKEEDEEEDEKKEEKEDDEESLLCPDNDP